jgi:hypothetical protein
VWFPVFGRAWAIYRLPGKLNKFQAFYGAAEE